VLIKDEAGTVPESVRAAFIADGEVTYVDGNKKIIYVTPENLSSHSISGSVRVKFSLQSSHDKDYLGLATDFLSSPYKFWRKQAPYTPPTISVVGTTPYTDRLIELTTTRNQTREWGNGRGDIQGAPQYFREIA
jgi:hypothetical protein